MLKTFLLSVASVAVVLGIAFGAVAQGSTPSWIIREDMLDDVKDFQDSSPIIRDMLMEKEPNSMVHAVAFDGGKLLPVYELLACLQLTNPKSKMNVDFGGGFDINIDEVTFPGGTWPVYVRIREIDQIKFLEKKTVLVLDKIRIGNMMFTDIERIVPTMKLLSGACLSKPS